MTYASIARGYATGGYPDVSVNNPFGAAEPDYPASSNWTYETGLKADLLDRRLSVRAAAFFNDVQNGHLIVFDPANAFFRTAALDYQSYGGELELVARLSPAVEILGGVGYTHASLGPVSPNSGTGARGGNEVPNVPTVTTNLGLRLTLPDGSLGLPGRFSSELDWQHIGARAADVANHFDLGSYDVVNARVGWKRGDLEIYGFARNLLDQRYFAAGQYFTPAVQSVRVGQGRVVGFGLAVSY